MKERKPPRKPSRPLRHILFRKGEPPYAVSERLPETAKELEEAVVRKFIATLAHRERRRLHSLTRSDPWPDFEAQEAGQKIGIEVVEVLHAGHARKRHTQELYTARVLELLGQARSSLTGLDIQLEDGYQDPPYPMLGRKAGRDLARLIAGKIAVVAEELQALPLGHRRTYRWQRGPAGLYVGATAIRRAPTGAGTPPRIHYLGNFPERKDVLEGLLAEAVARKIAKRYPRYDASLLLLAYGEMLSNTEPAVERAKRRLAEQQHPFAEVWYLLPVAGRDVGVIRRIWP
jgi:hypothetical protein